MKIFCDTNVLVAAFLRGHPHHNAARPVVERVKAGQDHGSVAAHTLAEVYAVLTRLPVPSQVVAPGVAWQLISENILKNFTVVSLTAKEYADTLAKAATNGVEGGKTYDALLLAAAAKSGADRIYTTNTGHFQAIAEDPLRSRIVSP
jgi:predicted nucleic acid-binding protein